MLDGTGGLYLGRGGRDVIVGRAPVGDRSRARRAVVGDDRVWLRT
jgi:hypothetical protein